MYLKLWTCTRNQSKEEHFSTQGHLYYFSHHTPGLLKVTIGNHKTLLAGSVWLCFLILRLLTILLLTPHHVFYRSVSVLSFISAKTFTSGLTEINVWKCVGELSSWSSCFPVSQEWTELEQHFLFPRPLLPLIHEDEWFRRLLVQVDSDI